MNKSRECGVEEGEVAIWCSIQVSDSISHYIRRLLPHLDPSEHLKQTSPSRSCGRLTGSKDIRNASTSVRLKGHLNAELDLAQDTPAGKSKFYHTR